MKLLYLSIFSFLAITCSAQFRMKSAFANLRSYFSAEREVSEPESAAYVPGLMADENQHQNMRTPYLASATGSTFNSGDLYWMSSVTTQSYNRGKLGTYYYWDVQGNLRESRMFFDIAGKNKRGLKLVFPRL